jgi:membrane associated rhomboid family serine protease
MPGCWRRHPALDETSRIGSPPDMFPIRDHNPSERTPFVTYTLLAVNIAVYLGMLAIDDPRILGQIYFDYGMVPAFVTHGEGLTGIFTSMFIHGGFWHLAGNMLFLWIFGDNLEDQLGHLGFALFYLVSGLGAAVLQVLPDPASYVPMVGASGAIAGVMGGYLLLFPRARVDVLLFLVIYARVFAMPAWIVLIVWFGLQVLNGVSTDAGLGGIAYWAHAGGFVVGFLWVLPKWLGQGGTAFWSRTHGQPPHPEARYDISESRIPRVRRQK